jgi:hypothetical protein
MNNVVILSKKSCQFVNLLSFTKQPSLNTQSCNRVMQYIQISKSHSGTLESMICRSVTRLNLVTYNFFGGETDYINLVKSIRVLNCLNILLMIREPSQITCVFFGIGHVRVTFLYQKGNLFLDF